MKKTNTQRQRAYRQRHLKGDGTSERIHMIVGVSTKRRLERMAAYYAVTQRELLERTLLAAERTLTDPMPTDQYIAYCERPLTVTA